MLEVDGSDIDQLAVERDLSEEIVQPLRAAHRARLLEVGLACDDSGAVGVADIHDEIELELRLTPGSCP